MICIFNNSNDNKSIKSEQDYTVGNSEFEMEPGWSLKNSNANSVNFNYDKSTSRNVFWLRIYQHINKDEHEKNYESIFKHNSAFRVLSKRTETLDDVNVQTVILTRSDDTEIIKYFFFEKNGKFYQIFVDIGGYEGAYQELNNNKVIIDKTVSTILRTMD
jgi:hypothetical protein